MTEAQKKLAKLRRRIVGRPICFVANGPSVQELTKYLDRIPDGDVVWVAHNCFWPLEPVIKRKFDVVYVSAKQVIEEALGRFEEFLGRDQDNILVTTVGGERYFGGVHTDLLKNHWDKVVVARCEHGTPVVDHAFQVIDFPGPYFSFVFCLLTLLKAGADNIVFFGLDGGRVPGYDSWYSGVREMYPRGWENGMPGNYNVELGFINSNWDRTVELAGLDLSDVSILNCSPDSNITCFEKVSYQEIFE